MHFSPNGTMYIKEKRLVNETPVVFCHKCIIEDTFSVLKNQYDSFKKSKKMYRLSLNKFNLKFSKLFPTDKFIEQTFIDTCPSVNIINYVNEIE